MRSLPESALRIVPLDDGNRTRQAGVWLRRRARRLQWAYNISRAALFDRRCFMPHLRPTLRVLQGGQHEA